MSDVKTLFANQVHVGHRTDKWNPKMRGFIFDSVNKIHVFDLEKTIDAIDKAQKFLTAVKLKNGKALFVGTKPQTALVINDLLQEGDHYFIDEKWCPGLLTNFKQVRRRVDYYLNLRAQFDSGEIKKYTKKEVSKFNRELEKLHRLYHGVAEMRKKPDVMVVMDCVVNRLAIEEARKAGIPIIGIVDTNADPDGIDFVIPANDDAVKSIRFLLENLLKSLA
jgi:small subunit ribosomal protein S2